MDRDVNTKKSAGTILTVARKEHVLTMAALLPRPSIVTAILDFSVLDVINVSFPYSACRFVSQAVSLNYPHPRLRYPFNDPS